MDTKDRVLNQATLAFAERGVDGTSLDDLAQRLGITKQTILYHFGSKSRLIEAVLSRSAQDLIGVLATTAKESEVGWPVVEAVVRASFELAVRRPELIGILRETSRLGPPWSEGVVEELRPILADAEMALRSYMDEGLLLRNDPRVILLSSYAVVAGSVTETEVLRALNLRLDLRAAATLRRTLLSFLEAALLGQSGTGDSEASSTGRATK